jgi:hypothetical protein
MATTSPIVEPHCLLSDYIASLSTTAIAFAIASISMVIWVRVLETGEAVYLVGRLLADPVGFALNSPGSSWKPFLYRCLSLPWPFCLALFVFAPAFLFGFVIAFVVLLVKALVRSTVMAFLLVFGVAVVSLLINSFAWITDLADKQVRSY